MAKSNRGCSPAPGDVSFVVLRVQVLSCTDLLAKDRNSSSNPFVAVSVLNNRHQTPVARETLNPTYTAKDATFDFPLYLSTADKLGALELIVWDKDALDQIYLGEAALPLEGWVVDRPYGFDDSDSFPFTIPLISTRSNTPSTGSICLKLGFVLSPDSSQADSQLSFVEALKEFNKCSRPSIASAAPTRGVGTIRSCQSDPTFQDDGGLSSGGDSDDDDYDFVNASELSTPPSSPEVRDAKLGISGKCTPDSTAAATETCAAPVDLSVPSMKKKRSSDYEFAGGVVVLEIQGVEDLPSLPNSCDMDPFVVISCGTKVFRTRVIRHSRNPSWNEKLLFHVRQHETSLNVQLSVLGWDNWSENDRIGDASFNVKELLDCAPQPGENGLYAEEAEAGDHPMKEFKIPLVVAEDASGESKNTPMISFLAKYQPYDALRQRFWRRYFKQYDADGTGALCNVELTTMLDSLGSTLSSSTITKFFTRYSKKIPEDELPFDEIILCLEEQMKRPKDQRRRLDEDIGDSSAGARPVLLFADQTRHILRLDQLDFFGFANEHGASEGSSPIKTEPMQLPFDRIAASPPSPTSSELSSSDDTEENLSSGALSPSSPAIATIDNKDYMVERVINVDDCPLCHRPRMNSEAELDIVTHIAVCASRDWNRVDRLTVGALVTSSQEQRRWYTEIVSKLNHGNSKLDVDAANIMVYNRMTGQMEEEKMQAQVRLGNARLGIRLLYDGMQGHVEAVQARKLLKSLSIKRGIEYDLPDSVEDIPGFIEAYDLKVDEILDPLDSFKNFNQFFYRKLKPSVRPIEALDDPYRLASCADCRLAVFETVHEATTVWIKGREFSVPRLLGDVYKDEAERYVGGALAIFRLAVQDYHRFHSPVDGVIGKMTDIAGEYYTVTPQAIRSVMDVFGDNARKVVPIDSPQFGRVMAVCVGAVMVGSILATVEEGQEVVRGQEFGYFAFGGSTIVLLFEKGAVSWDEDLLINSQASLETLVRVGMGIGVSNRRPA